MTGKVKVPLFGAPQRCTTIDFGATAGATFGVDLRWPDGTLVTAADFAPDPVDPGSGLAQTIWRLVLEIPPNVTALEEATGAGLFAVTGDGTGAMRTISSATLDVANGDGVAGDPTVDLPELPDTGLGAALVKLTRDAYGRVEGTEAATTDDLPEGTTNLYFTDERAQTAVVAAAITNGDTTHAPSGDAVAAALAVKADDAKLAAIAGLSANQVLANATTAKVLLNAESVDTDGCFDITTGRFTPNQPGLYLVIATIAYVHTAGVITSGQRLITYIYKNGAQYIAATSACNNSATNITQGTAMAQMNGTTDYLELYARRDTTADYLVSSTGTQFSAIRIAA